MVLKSNEETKTGKGRWCRLGSGIAPIFLVLLGMWITGCTKQKPFVSWRGGSMDKRTYQSYLELTQRVDSNAAVKDAVLTRYLAESGRENGLGQDQITKLRLRFLKHQMMGEALKQHVDKSIEIPDDEVDQIFKNVETVKRQGKWKLKNIFLAFTPGSDHRERKQQLEEIRQQLLDGADFSALAAEKSESQSRFKEGNIGYVDPEKLPDEMAAAIQSLKPGQLSEVVETDSGVSLFYCLEVRPPSVLSEEEVKHRIINRLWRERSREKWTELTQAVDRDLVMPETFPPDQETLKKADLTLSDWEGLVLLGTHSQAEKNDPKKLQQIWRRWLHSNGLTKEAKRLKLDSDPGFARMARWRADVLLSASEMERRSNEVALDDPTEDEIRAFYDKNPNRFRDPSQYLCSVISFGKLESHEVLVSAEQVNQSIQDGSLSFAEAAKTYSQHPSSAEGGDLGWRGVSQLTGLGIGTMKIIKKLEPGQNTGLIRMDTGAWIIALRDFREGEKKELADVQDRIIESLRRIKLNRIQDELCEEWFKELDVQISEGQVGKRMANID